jgi:ribosome-associated protein
VDPNLAVMDDPLRVAPGLIIPADELRWHFDPAGGPGGQHANRSATRVELTFDLAGSPSVPEPLRSRLLERLGPRAPGGVIRLVADETRSQWRNRLTARRRLTALLQEALRVRRRRRPTRPTAASRRRRLADKRHRAEVRRRRRRPEIEDD